MGRIPSINFGGLRGAGGISEEEKVRRKMEEGSETSPGLGKSISQKVRLLQSGNRDRCCGLARKGWAIKFFSGRGVWGRWVRKKEEVRGGNGGIRGRVVILLAKAAGSRKISRTHLGETLTNNE